MHRERLERFASWATIALMLAAMVALGWATTGTRAGAFWLPFLGTPGAAQYVWGYSLIALLAGLHDYDAHRGQSGGEDERAHPVVQHGAII
jgi:hypothetical protein